MKLTSKSNGNGIRRLPARGTSLRCYAASARQAISRFWIQFSNSQDADRLTPSLRANRSRECAPDDRLREAIHLATQRKNGLLRFARNDDPPEMPSTPAPRPLHPQPRVPCVGSARAWPPRYPQSIWSRRRLRTWVSAGAWSIPNGRGRVSTSGCRIRSSCSRVKSFLASTRS
jgi:hypothetical protein